MARVPPETAPRTGSHMSTCGPKPKRRHLNQPTRDHSPAHIRRPGHRRHEESRETRRALTRSSSTQPAPSGTQRASYGTGQSSSRARRASFAGSVGKLVLTAAPLLAFLVLLLMHRWLFA